MSTYCEHQQNTRTSHAASTRAHFLPSSLRASLRHGGHHVRLEGDHEHHSSAKLDIF